MQQNVSELKKTIMLFVFTWKRCTHGFWYDCDWSPINRENWIAPVHLGHSSAGWFQPPHSVFRAGGNSSSSSIHCACLCAKLCGRQWSNSQTAVRGHSETWCWGSHAGLSGHLVCRPCMDWLCSVIFYYNLNQRPPKKGKICAAMRSGIFTGWENEK